MTRPLPAAKDGDWLAEFEEPGQTFQQFVDSKPNVPDKNRRIIYLQPIGSFSGPRAASLERLREFTAAFFQLPVIVRPSIAADEFPSRPRKHGYGEQLNSEEALEILSVPDDAYCLLAVTMYDLYPNDEWNFVFGMASLQDRVGIFSFARYSPLEGELTDGDRQKLMLRAFKILSHEAGHMFGIEHCTAYSCGMNGANHLDETDSHPLAFCPVCLRKLHSSIGFDVSERDQRLAKVLERADLVPQAIWYRRRDAWARGAQ
jgi:archaemetzincin